MTSASLFPYEGDERWREPVTRALMGVVDPEMALNIVDIGLIYGVRFEDGRLVVRMTMTSAACPMTDLIVEDVFEALGAVLPKGSTVDVEVCLDPPWGPERMSASARAFMGWDDPAASG